MTVDGSANIAKLLSDVGAIREFIEQLNGSLATRSLPGRPSGGSLREYRRKYLRCHDEVVALARQAGMPTYEPDVLASPDHHSIMDTTTDYESLWSALERQTAALVEILNSLEEHILATLLGVANGVTGRIRFTGNSGTRYDYDPQAHLGAGGYGTVFKGVGAGGLVAVKRVEIRSDHHARADAEQALRELDVAQVVDASPGHNIMPILDFDLSEERLLLVMPVADRSLADVIRQGPSTDAEVKVLLHQMAVALQRLAVPGVLHRDIKPENILWYQDGWHLADFGIARIRSAPTARYTFQGNGTFEYLAPEGWNLQNRTVAMDLYALGCVAYEARTGRQAFSGDVTQELHATHIPQLPEDTDPVLARVINQLLAKNPDRRPSDARQVIELLSPPGGLSQGQLALQRLSARASVREREYERLNALAIQRHERRQRAREAFLSLWEEVVAQVELAVPQDVDRSFDDRRFALAVSDVRLRVLLDEHPPSASSHALMIAEVYADMVLAGTTLLFGNLICFWRQDRPVWSLHRYVDDEDEPMTGVPAEVADRMWIHNAPSEGALEGVDARGVIDAFVEAVQHLGPEAL